MLLIPICTGFIPISTILLETHAWLYLLSSYSSLISEWASKITTDKSLYSFEKAETAPIVTVCSPPMLR